MSPGVGFGEYGEGYVRLGLVENTHRIRQAARGVKRMIDRADEIIILENGHIREYGNRAELAREHGVPFFVADSSEFARWLEACPAAVKSESKYCCKAATARCSAGNPQTICPSLKASSQRRHHGRSTMNCPQPSVIPLADTPSLFAPQTAWATSARNKSASSTCSRPTLTPTSAPKTPKWRTASSASCRMKRATFVS